MTSSINFTILLKKEKKFKCPKLFLLSGTEQLSQAYVKHHAVVKSETVEQPAVHPLFCSDLHVAKNKSKQRWVNIKPESKN